MMFKQTGEQIKDMSIEDKKIDEFVKTLSDDIDKKFVSMLLKDANENHKARMLRLKARKEFLKEKQKVLNRAKSKAARKARKLNRR